MLLKAVEQGGSCGHEKEKMEEEGRKVLIDKLHDGKLTAQ